MMAGQVPPRPRPPITSPATLAPDLRSAAEVNDLAPRLEVPTPHLGAGLLSFCPALGWKHHHRNTGKVNMRSIHFRHFSTSLELISGISNPKGGNQTLAIRICDRYIFDMFSASFLLSILPSLHLSILPSFHPSILPSIHPSIAPCDFDNFFIQNVWFWLLFLPTCVILATFSSNMCDFGYFFVQNVCFGQRFLPNQFFHNNSSRAWLEVFMPRVWKYSCGGWWIIIIIIIVIIIMISSYFYYYYN